MTPQDREQGLEQLHQDIMAADRQAQFHAEAADTCGAEVERLVAEYLKLLGIEL